MFIIVFGGWQLFTSLKIVDPFFFGQPSGDRVEARGLGKHGTDFGSIWLQVWTTMEEAMLGFLIGVAGGVVLGVLLGQVRFLSDVLSPYIKAVNALPRIVLGSIFVIFLGLGAPSKVVLAAFLVFFVVFFNAFQGVREVDGNLVNNVRILGASRLQVVRNVVIPSALTWIIASLHVAFGFAVIGAIVGEFLGAQHGPRRDHRRRAEQLRRRRHLRRDGHHRRHRAGRRVADQPARAAAAGLAAAGRHRGRPACLTLSFSLLPPHPTNSDQE